MKHWTLESVSLDRNAPDVVRDAAARISDRLAEYGNSEHPRLTTISAQNNDADVHEYEIVIELAPGVILPAECGLVENLREDWYDACDARDVLRCVMEGVEACMPAIDRLSDQLHDLRIRARQIIGSWALSGVQSRLADARLAPYEGWRGSTEPAFLLSLDGTDEQLRTVVKQIQIENAAALENELDEFKSDLAIRLAARAELARHGASGTIDQLSLNAIAHFGEVAKTLRRFDLEWRLWLPDSTALLMQHGDVTAGNGDFNSSLHIGRCSVTLYDDDLPETTLVAARGRPVTDVIQHRWLSEDMTIIQARSTEEDGRRSITLDLDMPNWFFCAASGRTWRHDASAVPTRSGKPALGVRF